MYWVSYIYLSNKYHIYIQILVDYYLALIGYLQLHNSRTRFNYNYKIITILKLF